MYWFNPQWSSKVRLVQLNNLIAIWRSSGDWRRVNDECPQSTAPLWRCDDVSWGKVMKRSESWHSFIINYRHRNQRQLERKRSGSRIDTQVFTIPRPLFLMPISSKEKEKYLSTWKRNEPAGSEEKLAMKLLQRYIIQEVISGFRFSWYYPVNWLDTSPGVLIVAQTPPKRSTTAQSHETIACNCSQDASSYSSTSGKSNKLAFSYKSLFEWLV